MPDANQFLQAFGFIPNSYMAGYILTTATSTHRVIRQYHEYGYDITLHFIKHNATDYNQLINILAQICNQVHDVKAIRNYYRCSIDPLTLNDILLYNNGDLSFHLTGHAYRN